MAGSWTKLTVKCQTERLDEVCAVVSMLDSGLMIEDYSDFSFRGMYGELVDETILHADVAHAAVSIFVPEERSAAEYRSFLLERFAFLKITVEISAEGVNEEDWAENWKKYYKPVRIGRVTVVPAWENYDARPDEVIIRMDPGMAFGTGTHETTRLVLRLMQDQFRGGERVLDIGTGSGILSVCAARLGAKEINAYDIDPVAVRVARENAKDNGCGNIHVEVSDLLANVDRSGGRYDFVTANIVSDIILRMMPDLGDLITDDAPVILSGIIAPRADEIRDAVGKLGYFIEEEAVENDWIGFRIRKKK